MRQSHPWAMADSPVGAFPAPARRRSFPGVLRRHSALSWLVAAAVIAGLLAVIEPVRAAAARIGSMDPALIALAVALELASCLSYVAVFRLLFARVRWC